MSDVRKLLEDPAFVADLQDPDLSNADVARKWNGKCGKTFVQKWRSRMASGEWTPGDAFTTGGPKDTTTESVQGESETHNGEVSSYVRFSQTAWGFEDYQAFIASTGQDPERVTFTWGWTSNPTGGFWNKLNNVRPIPDDSVEAQFAWPIVQPADVVEVLPPAAYIGSIDEVEGYKLSLKCADTQIGFRMLPDGTIDAFHDVEAMALFITVARLYQPESIVILGDFLDLPSQGRFDQEASFAGTTQLAINAGHQFLAELRAACPDAKIILVEGNHDLRMQTFIQNNALAAFGLKRAGGWPDAWPVMSLPFLLRLDDLGVEYIDSYPAATHWSNDLTRNIHGTKANSKGSTMAQYVHELSHINTWAGHTHRAEVVYRTVLGARGEAIESYAANPGVLCRTDGAVPSVKGAIGASGIPAKVVEDWQQGFGMEYFNDTESWPHVYRIKNGSTIVDSRIISI